MRWLLQLFTWWNGTTPWTSFFTWRKGELAGTDRFGNRYYRERGGERRWVLYNGEAEASQVPPEWHAWLHHTIAAPPTNPGPARPWEQDHQPNLTGSPAAYRPPGDLLGAARRAPATGDYEPWRPT
ncbi:MAG: NADH:ubiquinone oxidoreductase subunit NDUFA12 [Alphaproteobacteria bacterium]|nr:NADH:ubiquinone oxidoreductase subunit NDUFA12 [Alphaproteobacteria bacterium]